MWSSLLELKSISRARRTLFVAVTPRNASGQLTIRYGKETVNRSRDTTYIQRLVQRCGDWWHFIIGDFLKLSHIFFARSGGALGRLILRNWSWTQNARGRHLQCIVIRRE